MTRELDTPSPISISQYITRFEYALHTMRKRGNKTKLIAKLEEGAKLQNDPIIQSKDEYNKNITADHEIECPRCHDIMTLCSDFDKLCYACEECDFLLSLN